MRNVLRRTGRGLLRLPRWVPLAAAVAWAAMIWRFSDTAHTGGDPHFPLSWIANLAHAPLFGILGLFLTAGLLRSGPGAWPRVEGAAGGVVLLLVGLYGVVDEFHQSTVPGRDAAGTDVVTDMVGALCVLWIVSYLGRGEATEKGVRGRLLLGVAACAGAALLASLG